MEVRVVTGLGAGGWVQGWTSGKKVAHVIKYLFAPRPISTIEPGVRVLSCVRVR
jgi:hypothetical protein